MFVISPSCLHHCLCKIGFQIGEGTHFVICCHCILLTWFSKLAKRSFNMVSSLLQLNWFSDRQRDNFVISLLFARHCILLSWFSKLANRSFDNSFPCLRLCILSNLFSNWLREHFVISSSSVCYCILWFYFKSCRMRHFNNCSSFASVIGCELVSRVLRQWFIILHNVSLSFS